MIDMDEDRVEPKSKIDEELLGIMQCPVAHVPLIQKDDWLYSTDRNTRRKYPIREGIPIMLIDESQVADEEEFDRVMKENNSTSD